MTQENKLYVLHRNGKIDWDSEQVCSNVPGDTLDDSYEWVLFAAAPGVALGGEKGEAVAQVVLGCNGEPELRPTLMVERMHEKWDLEQFDFIYPHRAPHRIATLYEGPVGKARMLTDLEITRCWEATFGYLELGIAIQHKFCEKNGIEVLS